MLKKNIIPSTFSLLIIAALLYGWRVRDELWWTAEEGIGYAMGIIGSVMMVLLLLYPLRKRLKMMHRWLPVKYWFGAHMALGVLGPTLILFHSNFGLGSLNSNVALYSMLSVSLSGLLGRFFYVRIHKGLYGRKIQLSELKQAFEKHLKLAQAKAGEDSDIVPQLDQLQQIFDQKGGGLSRSLRVRFQSSSVIRRINRQLKKQRRKLKKDRALIHQAEKDSVTALKKYLQSTREVSGYMIYESLFAWWHIIHIPLFIILIISALVHILAVHMY